MNILILGYVRTTCYAALYTMSLVVRSTLTGKLLQEGLDYTNKLIGLSEELDKAANKLNEE